MDILPHWLDSVWVMMVLLVRRCPFTRGGLLLEMLMETEMQP